MAFRTGKPVVLNADALIVFEDIASLFYKTITAPCVMISHDGEFAKGFPDLGDVDGGDKIIKVRGAAKLSDAVILLKDADMVVVALDRLGGGE